MRIVCRCVVSGIKKNNLVCQGKTFNERKKSAEYEGFKIKLFYSLPLKIWNKSECVSILGKKKIDYKHNISKNNRKEKILITNVFSSRIKNVCLTQIQRNVYRSYYDICGRNVSHEYLPAIHSAVVK